MGKATQKELSSTGQIQLIWRRCVNTRNPVLSAEHVCCYRQTYEFKDNRNLSPSGKRASKPFLAKLEYRHITAQSTELAIAIQTEFCLNSQ